MKKYTIIFIISIIMLSVSILSCKKWNLDKVIPTFSEIEIGYLKSTSCEVLCDILGDNNTDSIMERGFIYSKNENSFSIDSSISVIGSLGEMKTLLIDLDRQAKYYLKAFVILERDTFYSKQISFTTQDGKPKLTDISVYNVSGVHADVSVNVLLDEAIPEITERGFIWGTDQDIDTSDNKLILEGEFGFMTSTISRLNQETQYYTRAYALNSLGIDYSDLISFETTSQLPDYTCNTELESSLEGSIIYPAVGDILNTGSSINVQWNFEGSSQIHIALYEDDNYLSILGDWLINDGQQNLYLPNDIISSNCYRIVLYDRDYDEYLIGGNFTIH